MSVICPKDGRACPDDLCNGTNTCLQTNTATWERCQHCKAIFSDDVECDCELDYGDYDDVEEACGGCMGPCGRCHEALKERRSQRQETR